MKAREQVLEKISERRLIAVVRAPDSDRLVRIARALYAGGVDVIEFALTTPGALQVLAETRSNLPEDALLGVGTVLDAETARASILAGAEFIVMPTLRTEAVQICRRYDVACLPGALTPNEILEAWEAGGDLIKVFPASGLGPGYLRDIHGPLPHIPLVPTGGVSLENLSDFLIAGAAAVGVGGALVKRDLIEAEDWEGLTSRAAAFAARSREVDQAG